MTSDKSDLLKQLKRTTAFLVTLGGDLSLDPDLRQLCDDYANEAYAAMDRDVALDRRLPHPQWEPESFSGAPDLNPWPDLEITIKEETKT